MRVRWVFAVSRPRVCRRIIDGAKEFRNTFGRHPAFFTGFWQVVDKAERLIKNLRLCRRTSDDVVRTSPAVCRNVKRSGIFAQRTDRARSPWRPIRATSSTPTLNTGQGCR